jgi:hypothetical protein
MKMSLISLLAYLSINAFSQEIILKGHVSDINHTPTEFANVILLSSIDSTFITGTYTDENGSFILEGLDKEAYILKITYLGYKDSFKNILLSQKTNDVGNIELNQSEVMLNEVVITFKEPPFKIGSSGLIANVSTTLLSSVGTATDVIQRMPGITMVEDKITVFGKGSPIVYINNRKVQDNEELQRLESTEISTIELIANPGAKYDAEGRAVLLIKTKQKQQGLSAQIVERIRQTAHLGDNENINISYSKDNLSLFASYFHRYGKNKVDENHHVQVNSDKIWKHDIAMPFYTYSNKFQQASGGFDYSFNDKHAIGGQYQFGTNRHRAPTETNAVTYLDNALYDELFSKSLMTEKYGQHLINAFYKGDLSDRFSLRFDFDYLKNKENREQFTKETSNQENRTVNAFSKTDYNLYAGKLVNSYQSSAGLIEFGGEYNNITGNGYVLNSEGYTDNNIYTNQEQKAAAFIAYSHSIGDVKLDAGLRYEFTHEDFTEDSIQTKIIDRNYNDIYPNFSISKTVKNVDLSLAFNKRTQRPNFFELNGNMVYVNRFIFQKGNPYLEKTNIYNTDLQAVFKMFYLNLSYTYEKNPVMFFFENQDENSGAILSTFSNFPKHQELNAVLNCNHKIAFWQPNYTFGICKPFFSANYNGQEKAYNQEDYFFKAYNDFTLPASFVFSCNFRYQSDYNKYFIKSAGFNQLDLGLRKSFLNNQLKVNLEVYDIFNQVKERNDMNLNNLVWTTDKKRETRYIQLSVTYQLNNYKKKYRGISAAEDDINRF